MTRSRSPLPARTVTCLRSSSTSFTLRLTTSASRSPAPYCSSAASRCLPLRRSRIASTSCAVSTTGTRGRVRRSRTESCTSAFPHTSRRKKTTALSACFWVEKLSRLSPTSPPSHSLARSSDITACGVPAHSPNRPTQPAYVSRVRRASPRRAPARSTACSTRSLSPRGSRPSLVQISSQCKYQRIPAAHCSNCQSLRGFVLISRRQNSRAASRPGAWPSFSRQLSSHERINPYPGFSRSPTSREASKSSRQLSSRDAPALPVALMARTLYLKSSAGKKKELLSFR